MFDSEIKNHLDISTKEVAILNQLDVDNCLFTSELLVTLLRSYKNESNYFKHSSNNHRKMYKNIEGVYLIVFRVINKEKKFLIYNYVYYNDLLYLTLIVYFLVRNYFIAENNHE
jgi:hypothetical protein